MQQSHYANREALVDSLSQRIVSLLKDAIKRQGRASLMVSGGSTPLPLFKALSASELDWSKVDIGLVDDRWVPASHQDSNERLVRDNLLVDKAAMANFIGMKTDEDDAFNAVSEVEARMQAFTMPFTVMLLGMGEDGHTASLFPCSEQLSDGLDRHSGKRVIATQPTTAPHQRMSLTLPAILNTTTLFLHLVGDSKKQVLDKALAEQDEMAMPIRAVLNAADVELVWAP